MEEMDYINDMLDEQIITPEDAAYLRQQITEDLDDLDEPLFAG